MRGRAMIVTPSFKALGDRSPPRRARSSCPERCMSASPGAVENWFASVPAAWRERAQHLRELILESAPGMEERWMFKSAPFMVHNGWLCYFALQREGEGRRGATGHRLLQRCAHVRPGRALRADQSQADPALPAAQATRPDERRRVQEIGG